MVYRVGVTLQNQFGLGVFIKPRWLLGVIWRYSKEFCLQYGWIRCLFSVEKCRLKNKCIYVSVILVNLSPLWAPMGLISREKLIKGIWYSTIHIYKHKNWRKKTKKIIKVTLTNYIVILKNETITCHLRGLSAIRKKLQITLK